MLERKSFSKIPEVLKLPDLIEIQTVSYDTFLQRDVPQERRAETGLQSALRNTFPIVSNKSDMTLDFAGYSLSGPQYNAQECQRRGMDYCLSLWAKLRLVVADEKKAGGQPREEELYFGTLPLMTDNGTFIINGAERVVVSQLHRSPGAFYGVKTYPGEKRIYSGQIIPYRGAWLEFEFDSYDCMYVSIDRKRKMPATVLLRAVGYGSEAEIIRLFYKIKKVSVGEELPGKILASDYELGGGVRVKAGEEVTDEFVVGLGAKGIDFVEVVDCPPQTAYIINTLKKDNTSSQEEALVEVYRRLRPGDPSSADNAKAAFERLFFNEKYYNLAPVGRFKLNKKLGVNGPPGRTALLKEDIVAGMRYLVDTRNGEGEVDDIDHLGNRRVRTVGELVEERMRIGLARLERSARERMNIQDKTVAQPHNLVNTRLVSGVIKDFFARSQLSQFMDQINPLAELTHKRRLSALGPGGLNRKRAGFEVRDVHFSHYGRICPVETPEGPNIGLIASLSMYARVNEYGFLETPYRQVLEGRVTERIVYLPADVEEEHVIAQANARLDEKGYLVEKQILARFREGFPHVSAKEIEYMDVSPKQLVSMSADLIPFLEHDDANRVLMGCNMQRQAVPLIKAEPPIVGTGMEHTAARDSGAAIAARSDGLVESVSGDYIIVRKKDGAIDKYFLKTFVRSNQNTCINQVPICYCGDWVKKGEIIADGPATSSGELSLGRNVLVAFMPWRGYNFEDAILVSERMVKDDLFTSIHIEVFETEARDTKLGPEEITSDIPNVGEEMLRNLDEAGIVRIGAEVGPGNILVGKITPKAEVEPSPEEKLLRAIFGEKAADVQDTSLVVSPGMEGIVVRVDCFSRKVAEAEAARKEIRRTRDECSRRKAQLVKAREEAIFSLIEGKTLSCDFASNTTGKVVVKGGTRVTRQVLARLKSFDMADLDIKGGGEFLRVRGIINLYDVKLAELGQERASQIDRIRHGDDLAPGVIKVVKVYIASKRKLSVGDKVSGRHGNKGVIAKILPEEDMPYLIDGVPVDIVLNPLGVPSRMNLGQILETHLGWAARELGLYVASPVFDGAGEDEIRESLRLAGLPENGATTIFDGYTGEPFEGKVTVGYTYVMKLNHLVQDKIHARATGPYSLITQQPLGGKAQFGGQRVGEMEVWALEAYGAAYTLQEFLTVKSDDVDGRTRIYETIVRGENTLQPGIPESFNVLMKELMGLGLDVKREKVKGEIVDLDSISIKIASAEVIKSWSKGEVRKPETINYRTFKPERDGLFCERIFGPVKDWECNCGKYKRIKYKGVVCDRCGVEVTLSKVRRERMGHINLVCPICHIWFFKVLPSKIGSILDMGIGALEQVIYYEKYVVTVPGTTPLKSGELLSEDEYRMCEERYGNKFKAEMGAPAIKRLLADIDLNKFISELRRELQETTSKQKIAKIKKRLKVVNNFCQSGNNLEWMVLDVISVIPPDLRPLVPLEGGRFATSDLNDLYRRLINRNERLKHLMELSAPDVIIRNEKRMLQEAVDALFDNGRHGRVVTGSNNRPLKSLSDMLKGKQGRFRQNLLGKRVDYSGRSVIVVNPALKFYQCGLPKSMALELFEPFIVKKLRDAGYVHTIRSAKRMVEEIKDEVWDVLEEVIREHPVLLNRAPTLHRLGIQAFEPVLVEGKAIQIHPLVCGAFNADFDGDQMAVHIPLSIEAQLEARVLMLSSCNIFSSSNGKPIMMPSQDIVLGCYYLTKGRKGVKGEGRVFADRGEAILAQALGVVDSHAFIKLRENGKLLDTTVGRVLFNELFSRGDGSFPFINVEIDKSKLSELISQCWGRFGYSEMSGLLDDLKVIGFEEATIGGISISSDNVKVSFGKKALLDEAEVEVQRTNAQYKKGLITEGERYNRVIDIWTHATDKLSDALFKVMEQEMGGFNPIFMMASSGARGSRLQIRQLAGMRGLMAKPSGEIIESPISANFHEGLTVLEYFISTHGARKGLADTALKTANSGYLTRRLVDVAQDVVITELDCKTLKGIPISAIYQGDRLIVSLSERILGRVALKDITIPSLGELIVASGDVITQTLASLIEEAGIDMVEIRSVLTCEAKQGVCAKCYGWDLSARKLATVGDAVGVIAAQSIGEPGTQLTMRTFHIGGTASRVVEKSKLAAREAGIVKYHAIRTVVSKSGDIIVVNRNGAISVCDESGKEIESHRVAVGSIVRIENGAGVKKGELIAQWDPYTMPMFAEVDGAVGFEDIIDGVTVRDEFDRKTSHTRRVITEHKGQRHPQIIIYGREKEILGYYSLPSGAIVMVKDGQSVSAGDILARMPREIARTKDITGGLPRVAELFEARKPKDPAIVTEISGKVEFGHSVRGLRQIIVRSDTGMEKTYLIPPGKHLNVYRGDYVKAGQQLVDGPVVLGDVLSIQGVESLQEYLLNEIQEVYRLQGVGINDKHIALIIRQMLGRVLIDDGGDTSFLSGNYVSKVDFQKENDEVRKNGGKPATALPALLGITRASLFSKSFISAASFQETTRVLTEAATEGKRDHLTGLKENVIMGHLIPAGTGVDSYQVVEVE